MSENPQGSPAHGSAESHTMDVLARAMPLVLSTFMHMGVALVVLFLGIMVIANPPAAQSVPAQVYAVTGHDGGAVFPEQRRPAQQGRSARKVTEESRKLDIFTPDGDPDQRGLTVGLPEPNGVGLLPSAVPPPTGIGPIVARAHHVLFVIDCSGSMLPLFDQLRLMMLESIGRLDANQQDFHVILFASGKPIEGPARRLVPATRGYKLAACEFLSKVYPSRLTDPLPALRRAFEVMAKADARPGKVIWLLTDSEFPDSKKVLDLVRARNADKSVAIYTFLYGNREAVAEGVMKRIAAENGGKFRFISGEE
ncbi:MAG TPA: VWA domain-containing protein [Phycisphaerae bacterium]|nr:VWA domain-containing protein [Phycisphaerae bacterium]